MNLNQKRRTYNEGYIKKNADFINWDEASLFAPVNDFSYEFIRDFKDEWNWQIIATSHYLSQDFIWEFSDMMDIHNLLENQDLSEQFINKNLHKTSLMAIMYYAIVGGDKVLQRKSARKSWQIFLQSNQQKDALELQQWLKRNWHQLKINFLYWVKFFLRKN